MSCLCATRLQTFLRAHICVNTGCSSLPLGSPGRGGRDAAALGPAVPPAGWPPPVLTSCPRKRFLVSASKKNPALIGPCPGLVPGQRGEAGCRPEGSQQRRTLRGGRCHCAQWPHVWLKPAPRLVLQRPPPPTLSLQTPVGPCSPSYPRVGTEHPGRRGLPDLGIDLTAERRPTQGRRLMGRGALSLFGGQWSGLGDLVPAREGPGRGAWPRVQWIWQFSHLLWGCWVGGG